MDFTVLHILNKWNHIVCGLFVFFFFTFSCGVMFSKLTYFVACI